MQKYVRIHIDAVYTYILNIFVYTFKHICIHRQECICEYVYTHIYIQNCTFTYIFKYIHTVIYVHTYISAINSYIFYYVCILLYICIHAGTTN